MAPAGAARAIAGALAFLALAGCNRVELRARPRANLLLVTIDTLRADHVGAYGAAFAETPTLDALAAKGVRFATVISSSPLTLPAHASLFTGRYPPQTGVRHNGLHRLAPEAETLAERLRAAGFATGAFVASYVLAERFGLAQGFDRYDDDMVAEAAGPGSYLERRADAVTDRALAWIQQAERPWFAWVHYYDPHQSYAPPPPFAGRFAARPYDGEIAFVDAQLARLVAGSGALETPTFVVATADHGESLGEHQEPDHGYTLYDAVLAVPLVLRGPGLPEGRVVEALGRGIDLAPTLLALLGLPPLPDAEGADLGPLWRGGAADERVAFAETLATELDLGWSPLQAIRTRRHHYVRAPRRELYDLAADARASTNLLERGDAGASALADELDARIDEVLARAGDATRELLDEAARRRLEALGYAIPAQPVRASGLDPKDGLAHLATLGAAARAYAEDDFARAETLLREVLRAMPESSRAHELLACVYLSMQRSAEALPHLEAAVRLVPGSARHHALLGELQQDLGRDAEAKASLRRAVALDPREPRAHVGLAREAARLGNVAEAERHARIAFDEAPRDFLVRVLVGSAWARAGQHERALAAYEDAARLDPGSHYAQMLVAIESAQLGRAGAADAARARAGSLGADPDLVVRLGLAFAAAGDPARAAQLLRELEAAHASHPGRARLARVLAGEGGK